MYWLFKAKHSDIEQGGLAHRIELVLMGNGTGGVKDGSGISSKTTCAGSGVWGLDSPMGDEIELNSFNVMTSMAM